MVERQEAVASLVSFFSVVRKSQCHLRSIKIVCDFIESQDSGVMSLQ